jgi:hypothetical protein
MGLAVQIEFHRLVSVDRLQHAHAGEQQHVPNESPVRGLSDRAVTGRDGAMPAKKSDPALRTCLSASGLSQPSRLSP